MLYIECYACFTIPCTYAIALCYLLRATLAFDSKAIQNVIWITGLSNAAIACLVDVRQYTRRIFTIKHMNNTLFYNTFPDDTHYFTFICQICFHFCLHYLCLPCRSFTSFTSHMQYLEERRDGWYTSMLGITGMLYAFADIDDDAAWLHLDIDDYYLLPPPA